MQIIKLKEIPDKTKIEGPTAYRPMATSLYQTHPNELSVAK